MMANSVKDKALSVLKYLPRVSLGNLKDLPHSIWKKHVYRRHNRLQKFIYLKDHKQHMGYARLGFEGGQTPFYLKTPMEPYFKDHHLRRQYPPLSLKTLQLMIDLNRLDTTQPIDLTDICNTKLYQLDPMQHHYGVHLTSEGVDNFDAKINIEVQHASEAVIAAIERCGGTITVAYYDMQSVVAKMDPEKFFTKGVPIPKRRLPPQDAFRYYTDPATRGYLANPKEIAVERLKLSQKYGYELPDISKDPLFDMLTRKKDPLQIFDGLHPGWVVNMKDKIVLAPSEQEYVKHYTHIDP